MYLQTKSNCITTDRPADQREDANEVKPFIPIRITRYEKVSLSLTNIRPTWKTLVDTYSNEHHQPLTANSNGFPITTANATGTSLNNPSNGQTNFSSHTPSKRTQSESQTVYTRIRKCAVRVQSRPLHPNNNEMRTIQTDIYFDTTPRANPGIQLKLEEVQLRNKGSVILVNVLLLFGRALSPEQSN